MSMALAEAPVVVQRLRPNWETTTTSSVAKELPDVSGASEVMPRIGWAVSFPVIPYARLRSRSLPPRIGRSLLFEAGLEQVGYIEDATATSGILPNFLPPLVASSLFRYSQYRSPVPAPIYGDEMLDWETVIEVAPNRVSGTLAVTLEYTGRGTPMPVDDSWDY
jgi:hypothetical protein